MKLAKYRFDIRPRSELILPAYKGSTFRGGFGHAFKRAVCVERAGECAKCKLQHKCVYSYVFETASPEAETQNTQVPHPFVIEPPLEERQRYGTEDRLSFQLILVCRAIDYIPYFIFAFEELGRIGLGRNRGEYKLEKVVSSGTNDSEALIYDGKSHIRDDSQLIDLDHLFRDTSPLNYHQITLRFLTSTRIKSRGKLIKDIEFELLIRNLLRRLSWLAEVHCEEKWDLDWNGLCSRGQSQRQAKKLKMGGFLGDITFEGDLAEFLPVIKLGEFLHVLWYGEI
jgi:hypothetical protein